MINVRLLAAWPNWLIVPTIVAFWLIAGVLAAELFGAAPFHQQD